MMKRSTPNIRALFLTTPSATRHTLQQQTQKRNSVGRFPTVWGGLQIFNVALNKRSRTTDRRYSSNLLVGSGTNNCSP